MSVLRLDECQSPMIRSSHDEQRNLPHRALRSRAYPGHALAARACAIHLHLRLPRSPRGERSRMDLGRSDMSRRNQLRAIKWRAVRIHKASMGCADCGVNDSRVLDLDHVHAPKHGNVSDMVRSDRAWKVIMAEVRKCDVVCANCHRIRTFTRKGW